MQVRRDSILKEPNSEVKHLGDTLTVDEGRRVSRGAERARGMAVTFRAEAVLPPRGPQLHPSVVFSTT